MEAFDQVSPHELEREFLESMKEQYEADGFRFTIWPNAGRVPDFLGSYRPDAIAERAGEKIAIEVKQRQSQANAAQLQRLSNLFAGHPEWQFRVAYMGSRPTDGLRIEPVSPEALFPHVERVDALRDSGEYGAALVLAWALLEAVLRAIDSQPPAKPRTPGTVIQTLAMNGYLDEEQERGLRSAIDLRNRTVHGDMTVHVSAGDVDLVIDAVRSVLSQVSTHSPSM